MTKPAPARQPRAKKVIWSSDVPLTVTADSAGGAAQMMWLRFRSREFDARVYASIAETEELHVQLGALIAAAKAEVAECARTWAAELVAEAAALAPAASR
jgi:hypothetical protein